MRRAALAYSVAILVGVVGIGLRIGQWYYARTLWLDEEMLLLNIRDRTFAQLAGPLWMDQTAPLGWLASQRTIFQVFGSDDRASRALPVVFGIATLICAVWVAVRWMKPAGAALFVLLCSLGEWTAFYALEAKPYAADAFWALLLPALAVWAIEVERDSPTGRPRRTLVWWLVATAGQWLSYGAIFVAPGCAALLGADAWRRGRWRRLSTVALQGVPWLASFGVHYLLVMRHARASAFLNEYWSSGMPPEGASVGGVLAWFARQAQPLAGHPGATTLWLSFWLVVAYGIAVSFRSRPALALSWLLVPFSAGLLAVFRLVPLQDRLAFWVVPPLYAAIAHAADDSLIRFRDGVARRKVWTLIVAGLTASIVGPVCLDIAQPGQDSILRLPADNRSLNDRAALSFLMVQREPGDVLVTTALGLPAVWWYGGISLAGPTAGGRNPEDSSPILELRHSWSISRTCRAIHGASQLRQTLGGAPRALLYLGFASRIPAGFQELVLSNFREFSQLVSYKKVADEGIAAIFDLRAAPTSSNAPAPTLDGCVTARLARRW